MLLRDLVAAYTLRGSSRASSATSPGASASPQPGHGGSNRPAARSSARRGAGRDVAVDRASVATLAVHDHRARQHQPPHPGPAHRGQQHRGAEVVGRRVRRQVVEVDPEPDHRGLVADRVHTGQCTGDSVRVPHVRDHQVDAGRQLRRHSMHRRQQRVQHPDAVPGGEQPLDHMRPDEPRSPRHQNPHGPTLRPQPGKFRHRSTGSPRSRTGLRERTAEHERRPDRRARPVSDCHSAALVTRAAPRRRRRHRQPRHTTTLTTQRGELTSSSASWGCRR